MADYALPILSWIIVIGACAQLEFAVRLVRGGERG